MTPAESAAEFCWPTGPETMRSGVQASLMLEAFALAHGLDTIRLGTESFTGGRSSDRSTFGFHETLSLSTSRAAVRACEDRVARRAALLEAGIRVPKARSFGFAQTEAAAAFGERFDRGALVKPRSVEAGRARRRPLQSADEIRESIQAWRQRLGGHSTYLVEQRVRGPEYSFCVVGDRVVSVVRRRNGFWAEEVHREGPGGFGEVHPEVLDHAVRALRALPSTPHGEVRMICRDPSVRPGTVVSVTPQLRLTGRRPSKPWGLFMAGQLIGHAARDLAGVGSELQETVRVELRMTEADDPEALVAGVRDRLETEEIPGEAQVEGPDVVAWVEAAPGVVAPLAWAVKRGHLGGGAPLTVITSQQLRS